MKKKGVLVILSLFLIKFVSAQFFGGGGYGTFSLGNLFDSFDSSTITYVLLFLIFLTIIHLSLSKSRLFRNPNGQPNTAASGVVSFAISALIVYYLYRNGYDFSSLLSGLGFQGNLLSLLMIILFAILAMVIIWMFKIPGFFGIAGLFFIIAPFTGLIYERFTSVVIGIISLVLAVLISKFDRKKREFPWQSI